MSDRAAVNIKPGLCAAPGAERLRDGHSLTLSHQRPGDSGDSGDSGGQGGQGGQCQGQAIIG